VNTSDPCPAFNADDAVHRYVAGTLSPTEEACFEIHLLECEECQRAVREGMVLREALLKRGERTRWRPLVWVSPLAAAAVVLLWLFLPLENEIERLGRLEAVPVFTPLPVRTGADSGTAIIDRGMEHYRAHDFRRAARELAVGARLEPGPGVQFFLGIAQLQTGAVEAAVGSLSAALEPDGNPYAAEAHFYLAKAWLRLNEADSALGHLEAIPSSASAIHTAAGALADSVREARR